MLKHSLIVFPVGVIIWTLRTNFCKGISLSLTIILCIGYPIFRGNLLNPLFLWSSAEWTPVNFLLKILQWVFPWIFGIYLTANLAQKRKEFDQETRAQLGPWIVSFFTALAWVFSLGRTGSSSNYTLELITILAVGVAVAYDKLGLRALFRVHVAVLFIFSTFLAVSYVASALPQMRRELNFVHTTLAKGPEGDILSEFTWHTTALGRPPVIIPFLSHQLAQKQIWSPNPLLHQLEMKAIRWIILGFPLSSQPRFGHADRWLPSILDTARSNYKLAAQQDDIYIYEPKP